VTRLPRIADYDDAYAMVLTSLSGRIIHRDGAAKAEAFRPSIEQSGEGASPIWLGSRATQSAGSFPCRKARKKGLARVCPRRLLEGIRQVQLGRIWQAVRGARFLRGNASYSAVPEYSNLGIARRLQAAVSFARLKRLPVPIR